MLHPTSNIDNVAQWEKLQDSTIIPDDVANLSRLRSPFYIMIECADDSNLWGLVKAARLELMENRLSQSSWNGRFGVSI